MEMQEITFGLSGEGESNSVAVYGKEVIIHCGIPTHTSGSSQVKIRTIVKYNWDHRAYHGRVVTTDRSNTYVAYAIQPYGKTSGALRVINMDTEDRGLIKNIRGQIQDMDFAWNLTHTLLASVDSFGQLYVYRIIQKDDKVLCDMVLQVNRSEVISTTEYHRVLWCPYLPEDEPSSSRSNGDASKLLLVTHNEVLEIWDLDAVVDAYGNGPLNIDQVSYGRLTIVQHSEPIIEAAFSPDGSALATASLDGKVEFFEVNLPLEKETKALHCWQPHEGRPISCLRFLDDRKNTQAIDLKFWKFALTGCDGNKELKIWSCETWECMQKITFRPEDKVDQVILRVELDLSSNFLVLSDISRRMLYVLSLYQDPIGSTNQIVSISELPISSPILSFDIIEAGVRRIRYESNGDEDEEEEELKNLEQLVIRLYAIQPKAMQECTLIFKPESSAPCPPATSSLPTVSFGDSGSFFQDSLHDLSNTSMSKISVESKYDETVSDKTLGKTDIYPSVNSDASDLEVQQILSSQTQLDGQGSEDQEAIEDDEEGVVEMNGIDEYIEVTTKKQHFPDPPIDLVMMEGTKEEWSEEDEGKDVLVELDDKENEGIHANKSVTAASVFMGLTTPGGGDAPRRSSLPNEAPSVESKLEIITASLNRVAHTLQSHTAMFESYNSQLESLRSEMQKVNNPMSKKKDPVIEKLEEIKKSQQKHQDKIINAFKQNLSSQVEPTVSKALTSSVDTAVRPIRNDIQQHVSRVSDSLKEHITKTLRSQALVDPITKPLSNALSGAIRSSFKEVVSHELVPKFEEVLRTTLQTLDDTIARGMHELRVHLQKMMEQQKQILESQCRQQSQELKIALGQLSAAQSRFTQEVPKQMVESINRRMAEFQEKILMEMRQEMSRCMRLQQSALEENLSHRSRAVTPAPMSLAADYHSQVQQLIRQGDYKSALSKALCASDITLVVNVCEKVTPQVVFSATSGTFPQNIIMALIQQLGTDLSTHTELKYQYLQESLMSLDMTDETTREYAPGVVGSLQEQLEKYISSHPENPAMCRKMKMILLLTKSILK